MPVILLARLGVDISEQRNGLGKALLKDAIMRAAHASDIIGSREILTHAKGEKAKAFYSKFGFQPSPVQGSHFSLLMKDIRKSLAFESQGTDWALLRLPSRGVQRGKNAEVEP